MFWWSYKIYLFKFADEVKKFFGNKVYKTIIPRNVRLSEAPSYGEPIIVYDPKSKRGRRIY